MAEMNSKESNPHRRLSATLLAAFESRIGAMLPSDYRDYLLTHNGGEPNPWETRRGHSQCCSAQHLMWSHEEFWGKAVSAIARLF
jgi:hypothetical protein